MNIDRTYICFKNDINKHSLNFHYNVTAYPLLVIGYVYVTLIPCRC